MTVSSEVFKNIYTCNNSTTIFPYTFKIFQDEDLAVILHTIADGTEVTLTLTTDYTVSDAGNPSGGNVTTVATYSGDYQLIIRRDVPYTQETDFVENDPFPADSHEDALDKDVMLIQQLKEQVDRAILQVSTATGNLTFPLPSANSLIGWDPTGTFLVNDPPYVNQVQVDIDANPDYLGNTGADGAIRVDSTLGYADGGDFVTLSVTPGAVDHDQLLNFTTAEHFTMLDEDDLISDSDTQAATQQSIKAYVDAQIVSQNEFTELTDTPAAYAGAGGYLVRVNATPDGLQFDSIATVEALFDHNNLINTHNLTTDIDHDTLTNTHNLTTDIDHDGILNYVADEHIAHSGVNIATAAATSGLSGGGDITATRNLVVDIAGTTAGTVASGDLVMIADIDDSNNLKRVTAQSIADLGAGGGAVAILDEGISLTAAVSSIDFVGAGVTATNVGAAVTVTIPGGGGGGATLTEDVAQATHGFSVGDWIYHNGTIYALADASAATTAESIGVVSAVADAGNFTVQFGGKITGLTGLTAGEAHFLSETAGDITATAPTTEGAVIKPVLIADSTTSGFIFNMRGSEITSSTSWYQSFTNASLTAGVLSVPHNLGHKYCQVQIFNNSDKMIMPDDITLVDADNLTVDLTSFGTLTGTWQVVVLDVGTTDAFANLTYNQSFVNANLTAGVLTVPHSLGDQYPIIQVYDENDQQVVPDNITASGVNSAAVDLSSFGTISGTWRVVVSATGGTAAGALTSTTFLQEFANGDLTAGVLTIPHNLGTQYCNIQVYDDNDDVVQPDDITATSTTAATIDLSSYGTITGTWRAIVIGPGAYTSNIASDLNLSGQTAEDRVIYDGANWTAQSAVAKSGNVIRDLSTASGSQAVTGVGFKPKAITFWVADASGGANHVWVGGIADGDNGNGVYNTRNGVADTWIWDEEAIRVQSGVSDYNLVSTVDFDSDGFTLNWTKVGSPTDSVRVSYLAIR